MFIYIERVKTFATQLHVAVYAGGPTAGKTRKRAKCLFYMLLFCVRTKRTICITIKNAKGPEGLWWDCARTVLVLYLDRPKGPLACGKAAVHEDTRKTRVLFLGWETGVGVLFFLFCLFFCLCIEWWRKRTSHMHADGVYLRSSSRCCIIIN